MALSLKDPETVRLAREVQLDALATELLRLADIDGEDRLHLMSRASKPVLTR